MPPPSYANPDFLTVENKSQSAIIKDLTKRLEALEKLLTEHSENFERMQVAAQAVEAYAILLWEEPSAIPKQTKAGLMKHHIDDVMQLRFQSQRHRSNNVQDDRTQCAFNAYIQIPIEYRKLLDELLRNKPRYAVDRTSLAHPTVRKSQITTFLASHLTQQNVATDLLRKVPSLEVLDTDGMYVPMFQEG